MVLPPVGPDGVNRDCADLFDVRVPTGFARYTDDERWPRPVGYLQCRLEPGGTGRYQSGPCNPAGAFGQNRHLFDALMAEEGDRYDADDNLMPPRFRLTLTCVRCGAVRALRGQLDAEDGDREAGLLDPVPLQAGPLLAQEISRAHVWGDLWNVEWTIYRDGTRVGWMATERGPRGKRYVAGALGRRGADEPTVKGQSPIAVLRKLARAVEPNPRPSAD